MLGRNRQPENRTGVQREFAQALGGHRHHTGIVRAGGDLVEQNRTIGEYEQFHAEHAPAGFASSLGFSDQSFDRSACNGLSPIKFVAWLSGRLPRLAIIAGLLTLANRRACHNTGGRRNSQYRQLTFQWGQRFHDYSRHITFIGGTAAFLSLGPSGIDGIGGTYHRLTVTRRAHHRLDHAWIANFQSPGAQLFQRTSETIRRGRQAQLLVSQHA